MYIESISFATKNKDNNGWKIDNCEFNKINLIAGKNASGKTRVLRATFVLVKLLRRGKFNILPLDYYKLEITLNHNNKSFIYSLESKNNDIIAEKLLIDNQIYFERDQYGKGKIKYESSDNLELDFEIEKDKLLLATKRDKIQHPSLEPIFDWIKYFNVFEFGDNLGQTHTYNIQNSINENSDDKQVVHKFNKGLEKFGDDFKHKIIKDFNSIGYNITDIIIDEVSYNEFALFIKESDTKVFQIEISQGMFRALSLIIQITYLTYQIDSNLTILIDDIGEGLDFQRANNLIKYLVKNAEEQKDKIQLIMTTNDRLVMNNIPLKYWIIVDKDNQGNIGFYNYKNSKTIFDKFKRIGLSNFDFFSSEYYKQR